MIDGSEKHNCLHEHSFCQKFFLSKFNATGFYKPKSLIWHTSFD